MPVLSFMKRLFSRRDKESLTVPPVEQEIPLSSSAAELLDLLEHQIRESRRSFGNEEFVSEKVLRPFRAVISELDETTALALTKAAKEYDDFDLIITLGVHVQRGKPERWVKEKDRATFHGVIRDYKTDGYYVSEALGRLRLAEPQFLYCDFAQLDEAATKHALALFRVVIHFVAYKGTTSRDTSVFLREHPERVAEVIDFIERRGVGVGSFNIDLFNLTEESNAPVLGSGVL